MSEARSIYPEEYKERFLESADIVFNDGTVVTPEEIWEYLTKQAPLDYPAAFSENAYYGRSLSRDFALPAALKNAYLDLTLSDRMEKAKDKGIPVALRQGGQAVEPYTAAGTIALRPACVIRWARGRVKGNDVYQEDVENRNDRERAFREMSFECCQTAGYEFIQEGDLRVDIVAPYTALRCSDIPYSTEAHRHGKRKDEVRRFLVDYPVNHQGDKEWAIDYFAENLRKLVKELDSISGKTTTEEDVRAAIHLHNEGRKLTQEIAELWWSAETPPTNSTDRRALFTMGALEMHGDAQATLSVLREARDTIAQRVKDGVTGAGIDKHPKRIFVCGSCVSPNSFRTEAGGAVIVGNDDGWSYNSLLVEEDGDPYYNLAKTTLSYPYEQNIEGRGAWTVEQIRKARADGVVFLYNWGCNTQSAISRAVSDYVKRETGIPTLIYEHELRGVQPEQEQNRIDAFVEMVANG